MSTTEVHEIVSRIRQSGLSIYDILDARNELFLERAQLEAVLQQGLEGLSLDFPLRTRSKIVKSRICELLGYPVPPRFRRTQPRFPGQNFDTFVQKSNNLQVWNEAISANRRYVLIRVNAEGVVVRVRVVTGEVLAEFDTTGTFTHKYQARPRGQVTASQLVSGTDSPAVVAYLKSLRGRRSGLQPITKVFQRLKRLAGTVIPNPGSVQERNRGAVLHKLVCEQLGLPDWRDHGQFPDVPGQLLEIKLQTATTVDLGLVCPDSPEPLPDWPTLRHSDVRYAVFFGTMLPSGVRLDHIVLATGADFFSAFRRFEGLVRNKKLQLHLPSTFFDQAE